MRSVDRHDVLDDTADKQFEVSHSVQALPGFRHDQGFSERDRGDRDGIRLHLDQKSLGFRLP